MKTPRLHRASRHLLVCLLALQSVLMVDLSESKSCFGQSVNFQISGSARLHHVK